MRKVPALLIRHFASIPRDFKGDITMPQNALEPRAMVGNDPGRKEGKHSFTFL
jgi:hypothetical protein